VSGRIFCERILAYGTVLFSVPRDLASELASPLETGPLTRQSIRICEQCPVTTQNTFGLAGAGLGLPIIISRLFAD
jgi:hypothetical protein